MEENAFTINQIIKKLTGDIMPYGATHIDDERLKNITEFAEIALWMVNELSFIASRYENGQQYSVKEIGRKARLYCNGILESISKEDGEIRYGDEI